MTKERFLEIERAQLDQFEGIARGDPGMKDLDINYYEWRELFESFTLSDPEQVVDLRTFLAAKKSKERSC